MSRGAEEVHGGYFSIDKRSKREVDTEEGNQAGREAAEQAYNLIMKDKEKLLKGLAENLAKVRSSGSLPGLGKSG